jgi:hypothetical protein
MPEYMPTYQQLPPPPPQYEATVSRYEEPPPPRYAAPPGSYRYDTGEEVPQEYEAPPEYESQAEQYGEGEPGGAPVPDYPPDYDAEPGEGDGWGGMGAWGADISSFATRAYSGVSVPVRRATAPATDFTPVLSAVTQIIPGVLQAYQAQKALKSEAKAARKAAALEASRSQAVTMPGYVGPEPSSEWIRGVPNVAVIGAGALALFLFMGGRRK